MARRLRIGHPRQVRLSADVAAYVAEGVSADLEKTTPSRTLGADAQDFTVTGNAAALTKTTASAPRTLTASGTSFAVSGRIAALGVGSSAAKTWLQRISDPNVVWYHDFETDSEVNQFRWTGGYGNDPNSVASNSANCRRNTSDHPTGTGACLEINIPAGGQAGSNWWRPFSAMVAGSSGNGRAGADPAANSSLSRRTWTPTDPSMYEKFSTGYYGHPDYQSAYPIWPHPSITSNVTAYAGAQSGIWDGSAFYLQIRVKMTTGRTDTNNPGGKLMFLSTTYRSNPAQELVLRSVADTRFDLYTSNGNYAQSFLTDLQGQNGSPSYSQPGYNQSTCNLVAGRAGCWSFTPNAWHTVLFKITPGRVGNPGWNTYPVTNDSVSPALTAQFGTSTATTGIECWVARSGETSYTKIWSKLDYVWAFGSDGNPHPPAFNALICSAFMNGDGTSGANAVTGWQQRYSQIIFSKDFIPVPNDSSSSAPAWFVTAPEGQWIEVAKHTEGNSIQAATAGMTTPTNSNDTDGLISVFNSFGGCVMDQSRGELLMHNRGGHTQYCGNETYALSLKTATPKWYRLYDPTPTAFIQTPASDTVSAYSDGRMKTVHGWGGIAFGNDRVFHGVTNSTFSQGGDGPPHTWTFNRAAAGIPVAPGGTPLAWTNSPGPFTFHGTAPTSGSASWRKGPQIYDRNNNLFWTFNGGDGQVWTFNANTLAYGSVYTEPTGSATRFGTDTSWGVHAYDLGYAFCAAPFIVGGGGSSGGTGVMRVNLAAPSTDWVRLDPSNSFGNWRTSSFSSVNYGAVYHRINSTTRRIYSFVHSTPGTIRVLDIPTSVTNDAGYAWRSVTPSGLVPAPAYGGSSTYGSFNIVEDMGTIGGVTRSALVLATSINGPSYVMKLPVAGL